MMLKNPSVSIQRAGCSKKEELGGEDQ